MIKDVQKNILLLMIAQLSLMIELARGETFYQMLGPIVTFITTGSGIVVWFILDRIRLRMEKAYDA